ncbi:DUF6893 family small protein [Actinacidiphila sp. ITFR-21]|nr:hypothetical protein [Streptomyces sp. ITFR-21]WNI18877.1 hypothetical protein RLT57_27355 [Streptomyces sp. ITFR-21]
MRTVGLITTAVAAAAAAAALAVGVISIPDIRRYLKMRSMRSTRCL